MIGWLLVVLASPPTAARVVIDAAAPARAPVDGYSLVAEPSLTDVLEGGRVQSVEEIARAQVATVAGPLRRFDFPAAAERIERAWDSMRHLAPTAEGRELVLSLCLAHAQLAVLMRDEAMLARIGAWAASIDSTWSPDPTQVPPQVLKELRVAMTSARRLERRRSVEVSPPGARVVFRGAELAPGTLDAPSAGVLLWVVAPDFVPTLVRPDDATVKVTLEKQSLAQRAAPLVAAVRSTTGDARVAPARGLATLLSVEWVLIDDHGVLSPVSAASATVTSPFLDGFGLALAASAGLFAGAATVCVGIGEAAARDASLSPTLSAFESAVARAHDLRLAAVALGAAGLASAIGAVVRFAWVARRQGGSVVIGPNSVTVLVHF